MDFWEVVVNYCDCWSDSKISLDFYVFLHFESALVSDMRRKHFSFRRSTVVEKLKRKSTTVKVRVSNLF